MKRIHHFNWSREKLLHIETEGCIVNILIGLRDSDGHQVTSVKIIPDESKGEEWELDGSINNRLIKKGAFKR